MSPAARWAVADASVAAAIATQAREQDGTIVASLAGAQGSGKSTMAARLPAALAERGIRAVTLSLDDFYLTRAERAALAAEVHPLLATRGVPGTHDLALLGRTLDALARGEAMTLPRFDKLADDRAPTSTWLQVSGSWDVLILEGWCLGARPQTEAALAEPVNLLERDEDPEGTWRRWFNRQLAGDYASLAERLALRVFLAAPDFTIVAAWRAEQEAGLAVDSARAPMNAAALSRFIAHYERLTRWMLADRPCDLSIDLDTGRRPVGIALT